MTTPATSAPRWFAIDADHDISSDTVEFSLDEVVWDTGTNNNPPQDVIDQSVLAKPIQPGRTRYWFSVDIGPGNVLIPTSFGKAIVHGRVNDVPSTYYLKWEVYFKYE